MTSFTAVYEDVTARVTSEAGEVSTWVSSEDLLQTVRRLAKGHYSGLGGLSKRKLVPVTREECVATREEGTKTFQGWDSINEITLSLAPAYSMLAPGYSRTCGIFKLVKLTPAIQYLGKS